MKSKSFLPMHFYKVAAFFLKCMAKMSSNAVVSDVGSLLSSTAEFTTPFILCPFIECCLSRAKCVIHIR